MLSIIIMASIFFVLSAKVTEYPGARRRVDARDILQRAQHLRRPEREPMPPAESESGSGGFGLQSLLQRGEKRKTGGAAAGRY